MRRQFQLACLLAMLLGTVSGCSSQQWSWTGSNLARGTVDSLLGFPAVSVVTGASDVLQAGNENAHEARVEELSLAYDEFLDDRRNVAYGSGAAEHPIVIDSGGRFAARPSRR